MYQKLHVCKVKNKNKGSLGLVLCTNPKHFPNSHD